MNIFLTGGTSGIGLATKHLLEKQHRVTAPPRQDFDLTDFAQIDGLDLTGYDAVINCAGDNQGSYQGWHNNSWHRIKKYNV